MPLVNMRDIVNKSHCLGLMFLTCHRRGCRRIEYSMSGRPKTKFECLTAGVMRLLGRLGQCRSDRLKTIDTQYFPVTYHHGGGGN